MSKKVEKKWYESKTKVASVLIGIGPILATIGALLQGSVDFVPGIMQLLTEAGIVLGIFGIRDLPFINAK